MKSRLLKAALALLVPIVIDYVVKKVTQKKPNPTTDNTLPQS